MPSKLQEESVPNPMTEMTNEEELKSTDRESHTAEDEKISVSKLEYEMLKKQVQDLSAMKSQQDEVTKLLTAKAKELEEAQSLYQASKLIGMDPQEIIRLASLRRRQQEEEAGIKLPELPEYEGEDQVAPFLKPIREANKALETHLNELTKSIRQMNERFGETLYLMKLHQDDNVQTRFMIKHGLKEGDMARIVGYAQANNLGEYVRTQRGMEFMPTLEGLEKAKKMLQYEQMDERFRSGKMDEITDTLNRLLSNYNLEFNGHKVLPRTPNPQGGGKEANFDPSLFKKLMEQGHRMNSDEIQKLLKF